MFHKQLALMLVVFSFMPSLYYSALLVPWIGFILLLRRGMVSPFALKPAVPVFIFILQGVAFGEFANLGALGKDGWYFLKMLLVVQAGALIGYYTPLAGHWIKAVAWAAMVIAIDQATREILGVGGERARHLSFVALALTPFILKYYPGSMPVRWLLVSPTFLMVALSQSRTALLVMAIAYLGARGVYMSKTRMTLWLVVAVSLAAVIFPFLPEYEFGAETFWGSIRNSLAEISFEDGSDRVMMYANWRGFEAYRAYTTWQDSGFFGQIFGGGFGQSIELGSSILFGQGEVTDLPFAHNGYFTVLVKLGLVGVGLFVYFMLSPFTLLSRKTGPDAILVARLATTMSLILLLSTVVISGPLNKSALDGVTLMFGFAVGGLYRARVLSSRSPRVPGGSTQALA